LAALILLSLLGCGGGGLPVRGTVNRGGQPLSAGIIAFEPESDASTAGAGAVASIRDGRFEVKADKQLRPGRYLVRISPELIGSGTDLKTAPPQFPHWETRVELKPDMEPLTLDMPAR
jgi:hypothetical protein